MMPPPSQHRARPPFLPFILFAGGLGACLYFGQQWYALPQYSEGDIDASTEMNLQLDLQHRGPQLQPANQLELERMRALIRNEITTSIQQQRGRLQQRFSIGLIAMVLGFGQLVMTWLLRRRLLG